MEKIMSEQRCLMLVHAHPDDEVFSTGGIIARYRAAGDRVVTVYCTNGEAGEIHHPELVEDEARPRLGQIRQDEARAALRILHDAEPIFLGYRDSGMKDTEDNANPAAFMNVPLDEAVGRLIEVIRATGPQVIVTYDENGGYGHPDHIMANRIATEAFNRTRSEEWGPKKLYYTAASREGFKRQAEGLASLGLKVPWLDDDFDFDQYGSPNEDLSAIVDVSPHAHLKKHALAVHRTQIPGDFFFLQIPDEALQQFGGWEYFRRIWPPHRAGEQETDLFDGIEAGTPTPV
jgi:LmbE family N-acetylglucosaminyl deacetylase